VSGALLRKELRGALPLALLWWCIWGSAVIENGLVHAPDLVSFREAFSAFDSPGFTAVFGALLSLWLAGLLVPSEHASGTIEFLDSLPTTRDRVFLAKVTAGLLILWSGPALQIVVACGFGALSRSSLAQGVPLGVVVTWLALATVEMTILFSVALALSFLRRFLWLVSALVLFTYLVVEKSAPAVRILDVRALTDPAVVGTSLAIPWRLLAAQVPVAAVCLALAWLLFRGLGDRLVEIGERMTSTWLGRIVLGGVTFLSVGLAIGLAVYGSVKSRDEHDGKDEHGVVYVSWSRSHATTEHYTFTYPTSLATRAGELIRQADAIHDRVAATFEAAPIARIDVDATGAGPPAYAGRAFHETMQLDLAGAPTVHDIAAALGHETSHLYIDEVSNDRLTKVFRWTRCIHEGLANHIEHTLFRPAEELRPVRKSAALAHAWKPIEFETFIDDQALCEKRDPYLVYTVGEVLMASLVEVHGERAPVTLLRAFGRKDHPQDVQGLDLWRDAFQAAGFDLEAVVNRFLATLDAEKAQYADLIASLPRPRGHVEERTGDDGERWVGVTPAYDGTLSGDWRVHVRFRRSSSDKIEDFLGGDERGGTYWVRRDALPGRRASYQIGLGSEAEGASVWDEWREATLKR
jgi:hypothetical protein